MAPRDHPLIVGTAGHIDHGKTSLVKALTGVDLDALPEEKERGITIALGFTSLALAEGALAFVEGVFKPEQNPGCGGMPVVFVG